MMRLMIFLVTGPRHPNLNVIVSGTNRETAKQMAFSILGGDKDQYTVTPITKAGQRTVFVTVTETVEHA